MPISRQGIAKCREGHRYQIVAMTSGAKPTWQNNIRSVASDATGVNHKANNSKVILGSPADIRLLSPHLHVTDVRREREMLVDVLDHGRLVDNDLVYRQTFVIRSYEVGFDKIATISTITNLFQETSLNHVGMMNFAGDGMGTTQAMIQNRLIWIVTRMHIEMMQYPAWGDVVQIDSWVRSSGKNGMRRDFVVRDYSTGCILGRATSNWALMNQDTRRLSKMPTEVRAEISPFFLERSVMEDEEDKAVKRIPVLDESVPFRATGLVPKVLDLDMNQHVNHVKYIDWVLECVPQLLLMSRELRRVTLEYKRECGESDVVESLAQSDNAIELDDLLSKMTMDSLEFTHSLRLCNSGVEVLRACTQWTRKAHNHHHN
ncbi:hypothetical protein GOP47_0025628 [Adiantum capillus-veneris]|uniref:Acyl-[acyl-carrier-protein] hydrolase n=1 Tax=Adiantum capillus-veneris TaxID=13818 RepID=A0A9D4U2F4_ADICA|nr:hypothetical protein GOP47_0025628 [Adiantum capillus-veneris]